MADRSERLAIIVTAQDLASGKLGKVRSELAAMGTSGKIASVGLGAGMLAVNKGGQALSTFKSRLTSLAAPLAMIGVTGGLFSIVGAFEKGISTVQSFGETVDKTMSMTGLGVAKASALSSALAYVGVNGEATVKMLGMAEKNLGKLMMPSGKLSGIESATKFQKQYGLSILDSNKHVVDANELLLRSADLYTNKSIPASQKAITLSKIYGKSWQSNIEIFEMGRTKIAQAEAEMAAAGMTMTAQNMKDWEKYRDATRKAAGDVQGLELQLGLLVMPDITSGLEAFTGYVRTHQGDIKHFFSEGIKTGEALVGFITGTVIPAISSIAGAATGIWNRVPGPMQDLLVKGFVADRTLKFFFGMSPIHAVVSMATGAITKGLGGLVGGIFTRGSSPANPMFVSGGLGGGAPGVGGKGGIGMLGVVASAAVVVGAEAAVWEGKVMPELNAQADKNNAATQKLLTTGTMADLKKALAGLQTLPDHLDPIAKTLYDLNASGVQEHNAAIIAAITAEIIRRDRTLPPAIIATQAEIAKHPLLSPQHGGITADAASADVTGRTFAKGLHPTIAGIIATVARNAAKAEALQRAFRAGERGDLLGLRTAINTTTAAIIAKQFTVQQITTANTIYRQGERASLAPVVVHAGVSVRDVQTQTTTRDRYGVTRRMV